MKSITTRREMIMGAGALLGGGAFASPVRSVLGSRGAAIEVDDGETWENPYVTDGLVAMWDGEWNVAGGVHDNSVKEWRDIVGGYVLKPWNTGASYFSWNEYSPVFASRMEGSFTIDVSNGFTIEVCKIPWNKQVQLGLKNHNSLNIVVHQYGYMSTGVFGVGSSEGSWDGNAGSVGYAWYSLSQNPINVVRCIGYGDSIEFTHSDSRNPYARSIYPNSGKRNITIGGGGPSDIFNGLYNIRIYERTLTDEEILHNYEVDRERFGF